jgi:hypothetical protein
MKTINNIKRNKKGQTGDTMKNSMSVKMNMSDIITNVVVAGNFLAIGAVITLCVSLLSNMPTWS